MSEMVLGHNFKPLGRKADIDSFLVNATFEGNRDAFLVFGKQHFGYGKSYYFPRSEAWRVREPEELMALCHDIAVEMYGQPNRHDIRLCGDILLKHIDELVSFPPDDPRHEQAKVMRQAEQRDLVIKIDGKTMVDAR